MQNISTMNRFPPCTARRLFLFFAAFLAGCTGLEPRKSESLAERDIASVRAVMHTYATGWNAQKPRRTIMSLFTDDAVLLPHHGDPQVEGKEEIERHFWPAGLTGFRVDSYEFEIREIAGHTELAYSRGRYAITFSFEAEGRLRTLSNAGNYMMVFRSVGGDWKIARYIWNDPVPRERP